MRAAAGPRRRRVRGNGSKAQHPQNTHVQQDTVVVYYRFHPHYGEELKLAVRPSKATGLYTVKVHGSQLKIPAWMLSPDAAELKLSERPVVSLDALLGLLELVETSSLLPISDNLALDGSESGSRMEVSHEAAPASRNRQSRTTDSPARRKNPRQGDRPHGGSD